MRLKIVLLLLACMGLICVCCKNGASESADPDVEMQCDTVYVHKVDTIVTFVPIEGEQHNIASVPEWLKGLVSKTSEMLLCVSVGSNPTRRAKKQKKLHM